MPTHPNSPSRFALRATLLLLILAFPGGGCRSLNEPASASFASVTIQNKSVEEIATVTAQVFGADGYRGGMSGSSQMIFEKAASRATTMAREGLVNTHYGAQTINRVRVEIVPLSGGTCRLQCKAFVVTGAGGDAFFQDEVPLANIRSGPYKSLLSKVARQLK